MKGGCNGIDLNIFIASISQQLNIIKYNNILSFLSFQNWINIEKYRKLENWYSDWVNTCMIIHSENWLLRQI